MSQRVCQELVYNGEVNDHYYQCGRPAKAWVKDRYNRIGWNGRKYLCGIHERSYNAAAVKAKRKPANKLQPTTAQVRE